MSGWVSGWVGGERTYRVLKEADEVSLRRLLQGQDGSGLETKVGLEVLGDLTDEALCVVGGWVGGWVGWVGWVWVEEGRRRLE